MEFQCKLSTISLNPETTQSFSLRTNMTEFLELIVVRNGDHLISSMEEEIHLSFTLMKGRTSKFSVALELMIIFSSLMIIVS